MRWWAGKHLGGVAFVPPHGKPCLSYCVKYCELTALVAVRLDCASFCRLCEGAGWAVEAVGRCMGPTVNGRGEQGHRAGDPDAAWAAS